MKRKGPRLLARGVGVSGFGGLGMLWVGLETQGI